MIRHTMIRGIVSQYVHHMSQYIRSSGQIYKCALSTDELIKILPKPYRSPELLKRMLKMLSEIEHIKWKRGSGWFYDTSFAETEEAFLDYIKQERFRYRGYHTDEGSFPHDSPQCRQTLQTIINNRSAIVLRTGRQFPRCRWRLYDSDHNFAPCDIYDPLRCDSCKSLNGCTIYSLHNYNLETPIESLPEDLKEMYHKTIMNSSTYSTNFINYLILNKSNRKLKKPSVRVAKPIRIAKPKNLHIYTLEEYRQAILGECGENKLFA